MTAKVLKSAGLILGSSAVLLFGVPGPRSFVIAWAILVALFVVSRFTKRLVFFVEWSWPQFLVTFSIAVVLPYLWILFTFEF
jgi:hypothetical protein